MTSPWQVMLASGHEATEELVVWAAVRERCPDGRDLVEQVLEQESEMKRVWPRLADVLSEQEAGDLARHWETVRRTVPSKPHPHLMRVLARLRSGAAG